jgi:hypothetical protein
MTYKKPEITPLGPAVELIQNPQQKKGVSTDSAGKIANPAYDLDD